MLKKKFYEFQIKIWIVPSGNKINWNIQYNLDNQSLINDKHNKYVRT